MNDIVQYDPNATILQRLQTWISECQGQGVSVRQAIIVGAVAWNETACMMRAPRSQMSLLPAECYPQRPPVVVEDGNPNFGTFFPSSWKNDPEIIALLRDHGWVNAAGTQLLPSASATDLPKSPNDNISFIMDWLFDRRKLTALQAFSIGPTQAYMKFSPITGAKPGVPGRLPTPDLFWAFCVATDAQSMFQTGMFDYLPTNVASFPRPGWTAGGGNSTVGDNTAVETYLDRFQTGSRNWDDASMKRYASQFLSAVNSAWAAARAIVAAGVPWANDPFSDLGRLA